MLHAQLVWGEARGESWAGRAAVAYVPLTRLSLSSTTPKKGMSSLSAVILAPKQFSCFNANDTNRIKMMSPWDEGMQAWLECWSVAELARAGLLVNPAPGATHYVHRSLWGRPAREPARPQWFEAPVIAAGVTTKVAEIGDHVFARTA